MEIHASWSLIIINCPLHILYRLLSPTFDIWIKLFVICISRESIRSNSGCAMHLIIFLIRKSYTNLPRNILPLKWYFAISRNTCISWWSFLLHLVGLVNMRPKISDLFYGASYFLLQLQSDYLICVYSWLSFVLLSLLL